MKETAQQTSHASPLREKLSERDRMELSGKDVYLFPLDMIHESFFLFSSNLKPLVKWALQKM